MTHLLTPALTSNLKAGAKVHVETPLYLLHVRIISSRMCTKSYNKIHTMISSIISSIIDNISYTIIFTLSYTIISTINIQGHVETPLYLLHVRIICQGLQA